MKKWLKVALYVVGGFVALHVLAILIIPVIGGMRMVIDSPNGIDEAFFATIDGREEHIRIRGQNRSNPVVLLLHGGPGFSTEPNTLELVPYEQTYTWVQWDQPGAGRTFRRAGNTLPNDLTVEDIVDDGIAVAELVKERLNVEKLILLGWSWGSVVGVEMARKRPDLFAAYVGTGQMTSVPALGRWYYEDTQTAARETANSGALADLERIGAPPYRSFDDFNAVFRLHAKLRLRGPPLWVGLYAPAFLAPRYSLIDAVTYVRAASTTIRQFHGAAMDGPELSVDLPATSTEFDIPVVFIQGETDHSTPAVLAKDYFEHISAPHKVYVAIDDGGHAAIVSNIEEFRAALDKHVRPLVSAAR